MTDKEQLKDEQSEKVTAGLSFGEDPNFERVTELLKEAGDRAWAKLGGEDSEIWYHINLAEKTTSTYTRKTEIQEALTELSKQRDSMSTEDYYFIKEKLDESNELTE